MNKEELDKILADHKAWLEDHAKGKKADLSGADLRDADLRGSNIDYMSWPLWCGSLHVKADSRISRQLIYHALAVARSVDGDADIDAMLRDPVVLKVANAFHRVGECGMIEAPEPKAQNRHGAEGGQE